MAMFSSSVGTVILMF